ncbi:MAG: hypothetical protein IPM63_13975 [Acidobacteriota bacterium]|nr:MAG: hypothetical protein IPM63_13975 [Acidobacteriota bacterium]
MKAHRIALTVVLLLLPAAAVHSQARKCDEADSITGVKRTASKGFEYLIFEIRRDWTSDSPFSPGSYRVEEAEPPFTDYSGEETIPVSGAKFRKVTFISVKLYSNDDYCEIDTTGFKPGDLVKDLKLLYAFEGVAEFAVGFAEDARFISGYSYDAGNYTKVVMKFGRVKKQ